jgi:hypothetical protein
LAPVASLPAPIVLIAPLSSNTPALRVPSRPIHKPIAIEASGIIRAAHGSFERGSNECSWPTRSTARLCECIRLELFNQLDGGDGRDADVLIGAVRICADGGAEAGGAYDAGNEDLDCSN